jgi:uncharacterized protein (DUF1501 family)
MLTINGTSRTNCSGVTRRELLQIGGAGLFGMTLPGSLAAQEAQQAFAGGKAKSVIFLFLFGGPSQLETFDMKPDAKSEVRGPFKPIQSRTPDLLISEHLGRLARISDKYAVIRSMTHNYNVSGRFKVHHLWADQSAPLWTRGFSIWDRLMFAR